MMMDPTILEVFGNNHFIVNSTSQIMMIEDMGHILTCVELLRYEYSSIHNMVLSLCQHGLTINLSPQQIDVESG